MCASVSGSQSARMAVRICAVFLVFVFGGTLALTGKGFFCRDPDTGKLYAVNTTWRSTTFCGNYTCKLRVKDIRNAMPIREFKVSNVDLSSIKINEMENISQSIQNNTNEEMRMSSILDKILTSINEGNTTYTNATVNETKIEDNTDRYLNDKEIKMISNLLQSVKKSDLEAIVDIYNLAQDIYKELDTKTSENLFEETVNEIETSGISETTQRQDKNRLTSDSISGAKQPHGKSSYWYDPLITTHKVKPVPDLNSAGSDIVPSVYSAPKYHNPPAYSSPVAYQSYGKQPYFYEISDFQRQDSYVRPSSLNPSTQENPYTQQATEKSPISPRSTTSNPYAYQHQIQPFLMPFPYYQVQYHTYNSSGYPFQYYYGVNPYNDVYRKEYNRYYVSPAPLDDQGSVPDRSYEPGILLDALVPRDMGKNKKLKWKTDSLSDDILEDIRAHFERNMLFKPLCLRKKVKLEKVGKVYKLDEKQRDKRHTFEDEPKTDKEEELEAYIERTTCQSDVDPGFFRMGNTSAPYPACCPQRIS